MVNFRYILEIHFSLRINCSDYDFFFWGAITMICTVMLKQYYIFWIEIWKPVFKEVNTQIY
jgi:hypothetical protein